jgi:SAM-dependent methyltransferase
MREVFMTYAAGLADPGSVTLVAGEIASLDSLLGDSEFDVVLCHGVLMYLPESHGAMARLGSRVAPGGLLSVVARNGQAMAWRPSMRGDWAAALEMLDEIEAAAREDRDARYVNEIGVPARADTVDSLRADCETAGLEVAAWYGIRVASDGVPVDAATPHPDELALLFDVEERLGRTEPYRRLGTLLHVVACRPV